MWCSNFSRRIGHDGKPEEMKQGGGPSGIHGMIGYGGPKADNTTGHYSGDLRIVNGYYVPRGQSLNFDRKR